MEGLNTYSLAIPIKNLDRKPQKTYLRIHKQLFEILETYNNINQILCSQIIGHDPRQVVIKATNNVHQVCEITIPKNYSHSTKEVDENACIELKTQLKNYNIDSALGLVRNLNIYIFNTIGTKTFINAGRPGDKKKDFKSFSAIQKIELSKNLGRNIGKELYNLISGGSDIFSEMHTIFKQHYIEVLEYYFDDIQKNDHEHRMYNIAQQECKNHDLHFATSDITRKGKKYVLAMFLLGRVFNQKFHITIKNQTEPQDPLLIAKEANAEIAKTHLQQYGIHDAISFFQQMNSSIYNTKPMLFSVLAGNKNKSSYHLLSVREKVTLCNNIGRNLGKALYTIITSNTSFLDYIHNLFSTNSVNVMQISLDDILQHDSKDLIFKSAYGYALRHKISFTKQDVTRRTKNFLLILLLLKKTYKKKDKGSSLGSDGQIVSNAQLANQANNKIRSTGIKLP